MRRAAARLARLWRAPATGAGPAAAPLRLPGADWAWRPGPWAGGGPENGARLAPAGCDLGDGVRLFHDAESPDIQAARRVGGSGAGRPLGIELPRFDGGFLSLAIALPAAARAGLGRHHLIGIDVAFGEARPARVFARLNLRQGPNAEALLRDLPETDLTGTEFDLWPIETDPARVDEGWIDLIFEAPLPARMEIRDLVIARRLRAAL
ncbi:DUF6478 family protein [Limimaricola hongkongensis]|uniref:Uncharacterized protein n=1 Tax=Limimaricola hongkongensis DSM 17492 TaxID=1122180 RepID=A0A017HFP6_9RHOB|nr:DUF6478 family protein [Limimaricola hongkongensis]EYD73337.1 hypothetical protein Lokhon_00867 [Limimaricola hongkongensis DSM 17492]